MKVLLINGSPNAGGCTKRALLEVSASLKAKGVETDFFDLGRQKILGCLDCGYCHEHDVCVLDDCVNELGSRLGSYDGFVFGAPTYYAGIPGSFKSFLDRLFQSQSRKMYGKPGAAVVTSRRGGSTEVYNGLIKFFAINSMPIITSRYWNEVHGNTPSEVEKDLEGLFVMRTLGENMAYFLKCLELGDKAGLDRPAKGPGVKTNFIR